jgi:cytochrome c peroxidase
MHDGSLRTLEEVVEFYSSGGVENPAWPLDVEMKKLGLSPAEKEDLAAFLRALTGRTTRVDIPEPLD